MAEVRTNQSQRFTGGGKPASGSKGAGRSIKDYSKMAMHGLTAGMLPEIGYAVGALTPGVTGAQVRDFIDEDLDSIRQKRPLGSLGAEIGGSLLPLSIAARAGVTGGKAGLKYLRKMFTDSSAKKREKAFPDLERMKNPQLDDAIASVLGRFTRQQVPVGVVRKGSTQLGKAFAGGAGISALESLVYDPFGQDKGSELVADTAVGGTLGAGLEFASTALPRGKYIGKAVHEILKSPVTHANAQGKIRKLISLKKNVASGTWPDSVRHAGYTADRPRRVSQRFTDMLLEEGDNEEKEERRRLRRMLEEDNR